MAVEEENYENQLTQPDERVLEYLHARTQMPDGREHRLLGLGLGHFGLWQMEHDVRVGIEHILMLFANQCGNFGHFSRTRSKRKMILRNAFRYQNEPVSQEQVRCLLSAMVSPGQNK